MRIVVYVPRALGGVQNVTRSLADGLRKNGYDVFESSNLFEFFRWGFRKESVGIASLQAGFLSMFYRRSIYIVHGFPIVGVHNWIQRQLIRLAVKFALFFGSKTVAVSYLTKAINERVFGLKIHRVIHNGASDIFFESSSQIVKKDKSILFVGRFVSEKGVLKIIQAFNDSQLAKKGYRLKFVGNGELLPEMKLKDIDNSLDFLIECDEREKVNVMRRAEIFISLHDFEPMGVVFVEALLCRCKIVSPYSGGQAEFIPHGYPHFRCNPNDRDSIVSALKRAIDSVNFDYQLDNNAFSYTKQIAKEYIEVLDI